MPSGSNHRNLDQGRDPYEDQKIVTIETKDRIKKITNTQRT
jgi:hypothetical protein